VDDLLEHVRTTFAGTYDVERELSGGGMSRLFIATDLALSRPVVIKILPPELTSDVLVARFRRESEITAHLQHPHVLPIITAGLRDGLLYYVMPYIPGESLRTRLDRAGALPLDEGLRILREVASALAYAHERGVIHRDIKPENILLQADHAVLADFGISAALAEGPRGTGERLTRTGMSLGTVGYMAPEQALGSSDVDARADVYALGVVAYEMLAGEPPFTGPNPQAILAAHITQKPPRLDRVRGDVPAPVALAIQRALAKQPEERFQNAAEFASELDVATKQRPGRTLTIPGLRRTAPRGGTRGGAAPAVAARSRGARIAIPAAALVVTLAGLGVWYERSHAVAAPTDAVTVLVAPFDDFVDASQLWHEGMVDLMARNLDGAGALRTVAPELTLRRWNARDKSTRLPAVALAKSTGAQYAVYGHLFPTAGDHVRLQAELVDVTTDSVILANYEVRGPTVEQLADSLTLAVLQALHDRRRLGAVRLTSIGSRSPRALKAFLQGEQYYRRTAWDSAATAYAQAIAFDTNFAVAFRRAGQVAGWERDMTDSAARSYALRAGAKNHGLGPRDSLFLTADSLTAALADAEPRDWGMVRRLFTTVAELTQRYPNDPEAWYALGEARYHQGYGTIVDVTDRQVLEAFDRAIDLDPRFAPSYIHPVELGFTLDGRDAGLRYARAYLATNPRDRYADGIRLVSLVTTSGDAVLRDPRMLDTLPSDVVFDAWYRINHWSDSTEAALDLLRALARRPSTSRTYAQDTVLLGRVLPLQLAYDGHLRESYVALGRRHAKLLPELALMGVVNADSAARVFQGWLAERSPIVQAVLPWWAQRRDTASIHAYLTASDSALRAAKTASAIRLATYDVASARAYLTLARADTAHAIEQFVTLSDTLCLSCYYDRLTTAELLVARGKYADADRLVRQRVYAMLTPVELLMAMQRARIAEHLGNSRSAMRDYARVASAWRAGDPEVQPFVREASRQLAALGSAEHARQTGQNRSSFRFTAPKTDGTGNAGGRSTLASTLPSR